MEVTRFAPSPNGPLHLGHAWSAIVAHDLAREAGGRFLLRIEDIDGERSRGRWAEAARADMAWLGLDWEEVPAQSTRAARYTEAASRLRAMGLLYPCRCTRAEIAAAATATSPDGPVYPGTCRHADIDPAGEVAWRLDVTRALALTGPLAWTDELAGEQVARPDLLGDVVLVRRDPAPASYHLAVTLDDADDGVTLVTRGQDLFGATHVHRLLQAVLGLPAVRWHHHPLLVDGSGEKLAKRRGSPSLVDLRASGVNGAALAAALRRGELPDGLRLSSPERGGGSPQG